jgi:hypothetical protein
MSTRCQLIFQDHFNHNTYHDACIYVHSDGYPESEHGILARTIPYIKEFVATRNWDTAYLVARLCNHIINLYDTRMNYDKFEIDKIFKYIGFGIEGFSGVFHGDISYFYYFHPEYVDVYQGNSLQGEYERVYYKDFK